MEYQWLSGLFWWGRVTLPGGVHLPRRRGGGKKLEKTGFSRRRRRRNFFWAFFSKVKNFWAVFLKFLGNLLIEMQWKGIFGVLLVDTSWKFGKDPRFLEKNTFTKGGISPLIPLMIIMSYIFLYILQSYFPRYSKITLKLELQLNIPHEVNNSGCKLSNLVYFPEKHQIN